MPEATFLTRAGVFVRDLAERVGSTFVEAFAGTLVASWTGVIPADWRGWLTGAAFAAALATLKGLVAKASGDSATASLLPSVATRRSAG
ncbi:hypothetical protein GCM10027258_62210 [Amycolatopsis stemonae]